MWVIISVPLAQHLINQGHFPIRPIAHRDRTAKEKAGKLQIHKLPRRSDGGGVPGQPQAVDAISQAFIFNDC